ncbi:MAG: hypothetical protein CVU77_05120 [Elusimicrobia bacterium HGW-Elusimicrobia-1]|jgi:signal transduction histidine kinase|nr:MAG: hypothetical protein CVU77_05120 [Elusimicrobia bacterium HGW-Elusimicrobia-1]
MKFGVAKKIILLFVFSVTILSVSLGYYFVKHHRMAALSDLDERAKILCSSVVSASDYPVIIKDRKMLSKIVKGALKQKDVVFIKIVDSQNNVLYQDGEDAAKNAKFYSSPIVVERSEFDKNEELILGSSERGFEKIGEIYLTFSLEGLRKDLNFKIKTTALITVIAIAVTSLFIFLFVRFFVDKPIKELVVGTKKIGSGDLSYKIRINSTDEIGELAESFNKMAGNLDRVTVSRDALNKEIEERKKTEEQLIKTERIAAVAQIAAETAHEIRNPLGVIKTGLYYMGMITPRENTAMRQSIDRMGDAVVRSSDFIDDLLNISKPMELAVGMLDLNDVVKEAIKELPFDFLSDVEVSKELSKDMPPMVGDSRRLKQVVVNLIKNAVTAMRESSVKKLKLKTETNGEFVVFSVSDTGKGVSKEDIPKIFEPFFTKTEIGHGLGLTICSRFVEAHRGKIEIQSEVGIGTTFTVKLPFESRQMMADTFGVVAM